MEQPLLPSAVAELLPEGSAHTPATPSTTRGPNNIAVVPLGSERANGRPPEEPTPGQRAREEQARAATAIGGSSSPTDESAGDDDDGQENGEFKFIGLAEFIGVVGVIAIGGIVYLIVSQMKNEPATPPPTPPPTPSPTPWPTPRPTPWTISWPTPPPTPPPTRITPWPSPQPTHFGCSDTANWVDLYGDGCDWYEYRCSSGDSYSGPMGSADDNCCVCGGGSPNKLTPSAQCPAGWHEFSSRCFKVDDIPRTGYEAATYCSSQAAQLAYVHSPDERDFIYSIMNPETNAWIGGRNNSAWTDNNNMPWDYDNWAMGEPNNNGGENPQETQECIVVRKMASNSKNDGWVGWACNGQDGLAETVCYQNQVEQT